MCAIYTTLPAASDDAAIASAADGDGGFGLGRHAVCALAAAFVPSSHVAFAARVCEGSLYMFATPPIVHRAGNREAWVARVVGVEPPDPLWPAVPELAVIVGGPPARLVADRIAWLAPDVVAAAAIALARPRRAVAAHVDVAAVALDLRTWLAGVVARGDGVALHWMMR
jgi:hypothetical protein